MLTIYYILDKNYAILDTNLLIFSCLCNNLFSLVFLKWFSIISGVISTTLLITVGCLTCLFTGTSYLIISLPLQYCGCVYLNAFAVISFPHLSHLISSTVLIFFSTFFGSMTGSTTGTTTGSTTGSTTSSSTFGFLTGGLRFGFGFVSSNGCCCCSSSSFSTASLIKFSHHCYHYFHLL